jgi:hypothetical protein
MARPSPLTWLPLWQRALETEIGIAFVISGVRREYFRKTLYDAKKAAGDPALEDLVMFLPAAPFDNEIWICKKQVELES